MENVALQTKQIFLPSNYKLPGRRNATRARLEALQTVQLASADGAARLRTTIHLGSAAMPKDCIYEQTQLPDPRVDCAREAINVVALTYSDLQPPREE